MHTATGLSLLAALASPAAAFWRLPCKAPIVVERADPIIAPGAVSEHVHTIMGGNGFGFTMDYAQTQKSTCSSCTVTKDFSNYWVPTVFYKAKNGSVISVNQAGGATVYYLQRGDEPLLAFPEGFRMVAGNAFKRTPGNDTASEAISFACLGTSTAETPGFPDINCPDGLRAQVFFPSCWDGVNLDSPDHKSHMAYPSIYNAGSCPPSHPKRFVSIFYEVIWQTDDYASEWTPGKGEQPFLLASGDSTGYGYHGDFVNGWDVPTLQKAVDTCTSDSGVIEECPVFSFWPDGTPEGCKIPSSVNEATSGALPSLPGCNPIYPATSLDHACDAPKQISAPDSFYTDVTAKGYEYAGCGKDIAGQARTLDGPSQQGPNMTVTGCVDFCKAQGATYAGLEYADQCFCGNEVASDRAPTPGVVGNCLTPCAGDSKEYCGGGALISLYKKCDGACQNLRVGVVGNATTSN